MLWSPALVLESRRVCWDPQPWFCKATGSAGVPISGLLKSHGLWFFWGFFFNLIISDHCRPGNHVRRFNCVIDRFSAEQQQKPADPVTYQDQGWRLLFSRNVPLKRCVCVRTVCVWEGRGWNKPMVKHITWCHIQEYNEKKRLQGKNVCCFVALPGSFKFENSL